MEKIRITPSNSGKIIFKKLNDSKKAKIMHKIWENPQIGYEFSYFSPRGRVLLVKSLGDEFSGDKFSRDKFS
jgi:hypothetical protein